MYYDEEDAERRRRARAELYDALSCVGDAQSALGAATTAAGTHGGRIDAVVAGSARGIDRQLLGVAADLESRLHAAHEYLDVLRRSIESEIGDL